MQEHLGIKAIEKEYFAGNDLILKEALRIEEGVRGRRAAERSAV